jgi:hypothetical protein
MFSTWKSPEQGDALTLLLLILLCNTQLKVQESKEGFKLNRTHQLLVCAGNVNLLGKNIYTYRRIKR